MDGKNGLEPGVTEATAAPARAQNAGDGDAVAGPPLRFSAKRKLAVVQRLLRGEYLPGVDYGSRAPGRLLGDEDFVNLLRAEGLTSMPAILDPGKTGGEFR